MMGCAIKASKNNQNPQPVASLGAAERRCYWFALFLPSRFRGLPQAEASYSKASEPGGHNRTVPVNDLFIFFH
jgi:hypothetical protein